MSHNNAPLSTKQISRQTRAARAAGLVSAKVPPCGERRALSGAWGQGRDNGGDSGVGRSPRCGGGHGG
eukprot:2968979-Pleurochrysis_carterae.AAC.3